MRTLEERIRVILAIIEKDLRLPFWVWITTVIVGGVAFFFLLGPALGSARSGFRFQWTWFDSTLRSIFGISVFLTSLILGLAFASLHGGEIRRGTMRSVILYPMDMNDITIAKLVSSLIVTAILSSILFFGLFGSFLLLGVFPAADFMAIHATALAMSFLALVTGVFLAQWLAQLTGTMFISPAGLGALFLFFSILFTETALTFIGDQIVFLSAASTDTVVPREALEDVREVARALSVFSPFHVGGRILGILFGITRMWADVHVVLPAAALIVAAGYAFGRKVYLDIFVR